MLKIKYLEFSGIGRFVEKQRIDFTKLGALVQLGGLNKNTGGSSGAAKSTVINAVDFLFGISNKPNNILQSRLTKESMWVSGGFDYDGKDLVISRGKKLSVDIDGSVTTGNNKLAEEKIDEILGMPRELFRQMLHKRQKEGGFFLKLTPKEIHEFLTDCLGLEEMRKKVEKLDTKVKTLEAWKDTLSLQLNSAQAALEASINSQRMLGDPPKPEIDKDVVVRLKEQLDLALKAQKDLQREQTIALALLDAQRPMIGSVSYDLTKREAWEAELKETNNKAYQLNLSEFQRKAAVDKDISACNAELLKLNRDVKDASLAKERALQIANDIKKVRAAICPTCEQNWVTETAKTKESALMGELLSVKDVIAKGSQAEKRTADVLVLIGNLTPLQASQVPAGLAELQARIAELSRLISEDKAEEARDQSGAAIANNLMLAEFAKKQRDLREAQALEMGQVAGTALLVQKQFDTAVLQLKNYETARVKYKETFSSLNGVIAGYQAKVEKLTKELEENTLQLSVVEELRKIIKSYTSCCFDDALVEIGDTATRIIRNIPNMANATIQLEGTRETKDGKVKEEVNAVIHNDGEESIPLKSLCGGEESATDLAVDLAVIDFVENKANKGIDVFFLDEPFTGMDTVIIEQALDVLKNANINKRLIITDHNPEIRQMVESRLMVIREGATSQVVQE